MKFFTNIFPAIIFSVCGICFANSPKSNSTGDYIFKQLKIEDGLSQSTIVEILQDKKGYMWFATVNGLNKYDGYNFTVYSNNPNDKNSISSSGVTSLMEGRNGDLWVGTVDGNINLFNRDNETFKRFIITDNNELPSSGLNDYYEYPIVFSRNLTNTITSIAEDKSDFLWIGTWGKGVFRFNKKTGKKQHFFFQENIKGTLSHNRITKILVDEENSIWVATFGGGLNKIIPDNNGGYEFFSFQHSKQNIKSISDDKIISLYLDNNKNLWIGTYFGGVNFLSASLKNSDSHNIFFKNFRLEESTSNCLCNNTVMAITQTSDNYYWFGTLGGGLDRFDFSSDSFRHFVNDPNDDNSLVDNDVISLYQDRSGILWIGTHVGEGISRLEMNTAKFNILRNKPGEMNSLNDNVIWAIHEDSKNNLWFGTYRGGLNYFHRSENKFSHYLFDEHNSNSLSDNHIRSLEEDDKDNLWIGTYSGGLVKFNKKTKTFTAFKNNPKDETSIGSNQVQDIFYDDNSVIWIGTFGGGLNKLVAQQGDGRSGILFKRYTHDPNNKFSISDNRIYKIYKDRTGIFWIATFGGGLNKFDLVTEKFYHYQHDPANKNSLSDDRVMSIYEDEAGTLWIGTFGGGLNKFDRKTGKFFNFSKDDGLNSSVVYGILEDSHSNLWMSTDDGIYKFGIRDQLFSHYDLQDGLQSMEFSGGAYYKSKFGEMFFGGINGINYFFPDSIKDNPYKPPVVITSIRILNKLVKGEKKSLQLKYNENFLTFEFASLDYTNPSDNNYQYRLQGLEEEWNSVDASMRFANYTNLAPGKYTFEVRGSNNDNVWSENTASISIIITPPFWRTWWFSLILIITAAAAIYYLSTIRVKNLLAIEKLKSKLAADLHDNVGSGLTEISILSEVAAKNNLKNSVNLSEELQLISNTARTLVDNMSDIVWMVNPNRDSLYDLILRLKDAYKEPLYNLGISIKTSNLEKIKDIKLQMEYRQNLFLIFKESINNAIKHSQCTNIFLEVNFHSDVLEINLVDNGIGFDLQAVSNGNGLTNMSNRAEAIGGKIKMKSVLNKGTTIKFIGKISSQSRLLSFFNK